MKKLLNKQRNKIQALLALLPVTVAVCLIFMMPMAWAASDDAQTQKTLAASVDARVAAVQSRLVQVEKRLFALPADAPPEADEAEWVEYKRLLNLVVNAYESHLDALNKLKTVRVARQDFQEKSAAWFDFAKPGPYSLDFVDDLWRQVRAKEQEIEAAAIEQSMYADLLEARRKDLKLTEQALRKAQELLDTAGSDSASRLRWSRDLHELRNLYNQAHVGLRDSERELRVEMLSFRRSEAELLQRQVRRASLASPISLQDRDAKFAELSQLQQQVDKETEQAIEAGKTIDQQWQQMRDKLRDAGAADAQSLNSQRLQNELNTLAVEVSVSESAIQVMRLRTRLLNAHRQMWEIRYDVENSQNYKVFDAALVKIEQGQHQLATWRQFFISSLDTARRRLDNQEKKLADWKAEYGDMALAERQRLAYAQHESVLRRMVADADELDAAIHSVKQSLQLRYDSNALSDRVNKLYGSIGDMASTAWNFELFTVEDKIIADGREIVSRRGVTVDKIVRILFILGLGLWLVAKIADHGRRLVTKWLPAQESSVLLGFRLFTLIAVVGIVVFALVRVHIPLTVFTFFGGALAIGVGFGAQNIINNFISGLILLVERPIKLGDIVDVEGVRGTVTHIGSRCCQVHRFDGIDMLIPNSSFLEKSVTNWTLSSQSVRCTITIGIVYGSSVREALALVGQAANEHGQVLKEPAPEVYLEEFGSDALNLTLDFWVELLPQINRRRVMSDIRHRIVRLFHERGIGIAFSQHDVHLDSPKPIQVELVGAKTVTTQ